MLDLGQWQACVCKKAQNTLPQCRGAYTIGEQGKSVRLVPRSGEMALAIVLDGCVVRDHNARCDALFLYRRKSKYSFLVEIKGAGDISKAFEQLRCTRDRDEYRRIIQRFYDLDRGKVLEKFIIVSNGMLSKPVQERLENEHQIRVQRILHCEATTPIPDLKELV